MTKSCFHGKQTKFAYYKYCPGEEFFLFIRMSCCFADCAVDIVFVVDHSGSINAVDDGNWDLMLNFVATVAGTFTIGDTAARIGFVKFGNSATNVFFLERYDSQADVVDAILRVSYDGGATNTQEALKVMHEEQFTDSNGDRIDAINVAIVLTDGESTVDPERTIPEAQEARRKGITIFAIGIGDNANEAELRLMSSDPQQLDQNYFLAPSFDALDDITDAVADATCNAAQGITLSSLLFRLPLKTLDCRDTNNRS